MNDRELLELAAKSAGLLIKQRTEVVDSDDNFIGIKVRNAWNDRYRLWNPLTDDGDALRLLTKLPSRELYVSEIGATVSWRRGDGSGHGFKCDEYESEHGHDLNAATRRAIVRAAAEIGKAVP